MKKTINLLIVSVTFLLNGTLSAQYVTIPDPNFVTYLQTNFPSCMSGSQMDTTCTGITSTTFLDVSGLNIANLDGVQYFDALTFLSANNNYTLSSLPTLPAGLQ